MSKISDQLLGTKIDALGNRTLIDRRFANCSLPEFMLGPLSTLDATYEIIGCEFCNCSVESFGAIVFEGVLLRDVVFQDVHTNDHLLISSFALLDNVVISGNVSKGIWIKPLEVSTATVQLERQSRAKAHLANVPVALNVAEFSGSYLEILGIPADKMVFDKAKHFYVDQKWLSVDWDLLGIAKTSYWRIRVSRLREFGVDCGLFKLPERQSKQFGKSLVDRGKLEEIGLLPSMG